MSSDAEVHSYAVLATVSRCYPPLKAGWLRVTHPFATKFTRSKLPISSVRLACVKHAASVRPEPGSNSPRYLGAIC